MRAPRLVFLGLDGLPWSLAKNLCGQGLLPNLASIIDDPGCTAIAAELPELSPVNWTSLFTASSPGSHGVYGFTRLDPRTYHLEFTDFTHVHGTTIFERLAGEGYFSKVLNMPNLAPVRPMRAMLIAGFPAQDLIGSVHPPVLASILADHGYTIEADTLRGATDPEFLLADLHRSLICREKLLDLFWPDLAWDLFMLVLTETDRLGHFLFPALVEPWHPWRSEAMRFMTSWDSLVGKVLERYHDLPDPKRLIMMADHGFTTLEQEVNLNAWLHDLGLLHMSRAAVSEWDTESIHPSTRAFALDPGRIYLHTRERFARGTLSRLDASRLTTEIEKALSALAWNGRRVIRQVLRGPEIYRGAQTVLAPDLIAIPEPGFDLKGKFGRSPLFGHFDRHGMHTADDVFFFDSTRGVARTPTQVGQNILEHYGISATAIEP